VEEERAKQNAPSTWDTANQSISENVIEPFKEYFAPPIYRHYKKNMGLYHTLGGLTLLGGLGGLVGGRKVRRYLWPLALLSGLALAGTAWYGHNQERNAWDKTKDWFAGWFK
jgi:hypothetical protein